MKLIRRIGIVVCVRLESSRVRYKIAQKVGRVTLLEILLSRLLKTRYKVVIACPDKPADEGVKIAQLLSSKTLNKVSWYEGDRENVLNRFYFSAKAYEIDPIIRVTADDIYLFPKLIEKAVENFKESGAGYLYCKEGIRGSDFEIISMHYLKQVYEKYKNKESLEDLSYAFKDVVPKEKIISFSNSNINANLSIDYPEDLQLVRLIYEILDKENNEAN